MTRKFAAGDSVRGEKIFYCFGSVPTKAAHAKGSYRGTFQRHGYAAVDIPVKRAPVLSPNEPEEIHCESASFSCTKRPRFPGRPTVCGNHTCRCGAIRGDAIATIKIPLRGYL